MPRIVAEGVGQFGPIELNPCHDPSRCGSKPITFFADGHLFGIDFLGCRRPSSFLHPTLAMVRPIDHLPLHFFLSAGRTGTVFLANLLSRALPGGVVEHEPFPSRCEHLLGNLSNELRVGRGIARSVFLSARQRRLGSLEEGQRYIEINPLLCPIIEFLPELKRPLHVVHLVREPLDWAKSISAFRASKYIRPFFGIIPFNRPFPTPRPSGWRGLSELERQLWRWRFCNESILKFRESFATYSLVRYEDLFSQEKSTHEKALKTVMNALQISDFPAHQDVSTRVNAAPHSKRPADVAPATVREICGELMGEFGYA